MHEKALNPALIRVVLIVLFVLVMQVLRAAKLFKASKPVSRAGEAKVSPLESLRKAMLQAAEQTRARQGGPPVNQEPAQLREPFQPLQQPPAIGPESSFVPSLLLLALLGCLFLMAYRYWVR
jgi:hypothetical protein